MYTTTLSHPPNINIDWFLQIRSHALTYIPSQHFWLSSHWYALHFNVSTRSMVIEIAKNNTTLQGINYGFGGFCLLSPHRPTYISTLNLIQIHWNPLCNSTTQPWCYATNTPSTWALGNWLVSQRNCPTPLKYMQNYHNYRRAYYSTIPKQMSRTYILVVNSYTNRVTCLAPHPQVWIILLYYSLKNQITCYIMLVVQSMKYQSTRALT